MVALLALTVAHGQQVVLEVKPTKLGVGQSGTVRISVASRYQREPRPARVPDIESGEGIGFGYVGQRQEYSNRNGVLGQINQYEYRVTASDIGEWTVGPVSVRMTDGSVKQTNAVTLTVVPRDELRRSKYEVSASFSADEVWEGEVLLYRFRFETTEDVRAVEWRHPRFEGVRQTQQGDPGINRFQVDDPEGRITTEEGVVPLIATGTGQREQGPAIAIAQVPVGPSRGLRLLQRVKLEQFTTQPLSVSVKPLPPAPPTFSGLVGEFELASTLATTRATVGQSVTWALTLAGTGAVEGFSPPAYTADGVSVYEGDASSDAGVVEDRFFARARYERVLVPTQPGTVQLPPFELVTFDPKKGEYETHRVDFPSLVVTPGREGEGEVTSFAPERTEGVEGGPMEDATVPRDIWREGSATTVPTNAWLPWLLGLFGLPGLALLGLDGGQAARRWWEARRRPEEETRTARDVLAAAPASGAERLAALDAALRQALEEGADAEVVGPLQERLSRLRFAPGAEADPALEAEIRVLIGRAS